LNIIGREKSLVNGSELVWIHQTQSSEAMDRQTKGLS
jgi:hypothetical protein